MAFEQETTAALRILDGITEGTMSTLEQREVDDADPALLYLIFTWVRAHYGPSHEASDAVLGRLLALGNRPAIARKLKEGQEDPVVEWFEDAYSYKKLGAQEFIPLIIEKLEG